MTGIPPAVQAALDDARRGHRPHEYEGAALRLADAVEKHFQGGDNDGYERGWAEANRVIAAILKQTCVETTSPSGMILHRAYIPESVWVELPDTPQIFHFQEPGTGTQIFSYGRLPGDVPICREHEPQQHRDGKPPWCRNCGLTEDYREPVSILMREDPPAPADKDTCRICRKPINVSIFKGTGYCSVDCRKAGGDLT